ncbi:MAG: tetratricopeptide repeat protein [Planctomycetota bacterium]
MSPLILTSVVQLLLAQSTGDAPPTVAPAKPVATVKAIEPGSNTDMGLWLVNLARHQGHLVGRGDPRSASLQVLALLEAAADVDSECAEAFYWLYDLQHRMGQDKAAHASLARYVKLAPTDEAARIRLFEIGLEEQQNAEKRLAFVQSALKDAPMPPAYESAVRSTLARLRYERRESEEAGQEIENALRLNPMNTEARELAYEMYGETEAELQRVEMALQLVSINPSQANLIWDLGELLDRLSLHKPAQEWFNRAIDLHKRQDSSKVPAEFWNTLGLSYVGSGDFAKAKESADQALGVDATYLTARLMRASAERKLGDDKAADEDIATVQKSYDAQVDEIISKKQSDKAAEIAWFYCYYKTDKEKALKLADIAVGGANPGRLAQLAHGYALRLNGKTDEALKILEPLAASDQMAAVEVARIFSEQSKKAEAVTLLTKAAALQYSGIAFNQIRELLTKLGEKPPEAPVYGKITAALEKFHRDVFDFPQRPGEFLKFTIRTAAAPTSVGPINVIFRMENAGPFPITFGEGFMVRPLVALSANVGGEKGVFKDYLQVLLNARAMLLPGDALEKQVAVDVGALREFMIRRSGEDASIELIAMLDPVLKNNMLSQGPGTMIAAPLVVKLKGIDLSPEATASLVRSVTSANLSERMIAAQRIGGVLAWAEHNTSKAAAAKLPVDTLRSAMAQALGDKAWQVRAHALCAASWSTMDGPTTSAAAPTVGDSNAVLKTLAVRLFAPQQGEKFKPVLEQLLKTDASHFVRLIAASYLPDGARMQASSSAVGSP